MSEIGVVLLAHLFTNFSFANLFFGQFLTSINLSLPQRELGDDESREYHLISIDLFSLNDLVWVLSYL